MPDNAGMELIDGQIVDKGISQDSSEKEAIILIVVGNFLLKNRVAKVFPATLGYRCFPDDPNRMRKPDVTVITNARLKQLPPGDRGYMPIVPDMAVEVLSPNDVLYGVGTKIDEYQEAGFPLLWVADPHRRTVTVYPLDGRPTILLQDDEITAESVLPGFRGKVGDFFPVVQSK